MTVALACAGGLRGDSAASLQLLQTQHEEAHGRFAAQLLELAAVTDGQGLTEAAALIRQLALPMDRQAGGGDDLPEEVLPEFAVTMPTHERQWRGQLRRLRQEYAQELYMLSRRALRARHPSLAFHLIREVAWHNPDHPHARQLLGYVRRGNHWVTPYADLMLQRGNVWDERYGWLPASHVERYASGQRYFKNQWMSAEEEAALRHDFRNAWEVTSDHFVITTNQSLERGVELSVALEALHGFVLREFAAFFNSPQQMQALFEGGRQDAGLRARRHDVHYYQSRQEFIFRLEARQPGVEVSNGLYLPNDRTAYSFHNPEDTDTTQETLFHEVTHQLLGESQRKVPTDLGHQANFWLIEGIACYMESFTFGGMGQANAGDPQHPRIVAARHRLLDRNFYIPLAKFTAMGMREFQTPQQMDTLRGYYSQASGLTHFFLHYEDGLYRDALIEHLAQIYSPIARVRSQPQSLAELTGVPFDVLDRQYVSYITEMRAQLEEAAIAPP